jgi:hypothetical protein
VPKVELDKIKAEAARKVGEKELDTSCAT